MEQWRLAEQKVGQTHDDDAAADAAYDNVHQSWSTSTSSHYLTRMLLHVIYCDECIIKFILLIVV